MIVVDASALLEFILQTPLGAPGFRAPIEVVV